MPQDTPLVHFLRDEAENETDDVGLAIVPRDPYESGDEELDVVVDTEVEDAEGAKAPKSGPYPKSRDWSSKKIELPSFPKHESINCNLRGLNPVEIFELFFDSEVYG